MAKYRDNLPQLGNDIYACYTGMDTELLYTRRIDLPGFASYPLLSTLEGKNILREYYSNLVELAREQNVGVILDSVTWIANRDRGGELGYSPDDLKNFNIDAIGLIASVREEKGELPTVLCGDIGPRGDGYAPSYLMSIEETAGVMRTAQRYDMPVAIAFTIETDGRLPTGMPLKEAIEKVDTVSDGGALYFLVNCAHPDHFTGIFNEEPWMHRLRGVVANASRCSHSELEVAEDLDEGNPDELGTLVGGLRKPYPHFNIVGGCCGTDMRHMKRILEEAKSAY